MSKENLVIKEGMELASGKWSKYTKAITEGYKRAHNGELPDSNLLSTTAICLENTQHVIQQMDETTRVVNLGNFIDYGFGIVTAVMPSLVANEIVSVQPLKARSGEIFFLKFTYGSNKGTIKRGDEMFSPITGPANTVDYTSENVTSEEFATTDATGLSKVEGNLSYLPVAPSSVEISDGTSTYTDDGKGAITVKSGGTTFTAGTIDYATGHVVLEYSAALANASLTANYQFEFTNQGVGATIPEVDVDLHSTTISTVARKLRARWLFDAAFELKQTHGVDADVELSAALSSEIRHEIDSEIMNDLLAAASNTDGSATFTWSQTAPTGVARIDYKDTFVDLLIRMSNTIFANTKRGYGNFIVAGVNVCSIIESMGSRFKPDNSPVKNGPHFAGMLDGRWRVYKNPFYPSDQFVVGYKGSSYLEGGYVYAPYLPLYVTPSVMLDDFVTRKGCMTRYGKKMINPYFYVKGNLVD